MRRCQFVIGCLVSFIFFQATALAQNQALIDSLKNFIAHQPDDTLKIKTINALTWQLIITRQQTKLAKQYADSGRRLSEQLNYQFGIAKSHYYYGVIGRLEGDYYEALNHFDQYNAYATSRGDRINVANGLYHMAVINSFQGNYEKSLDIHYRILKIYEEEQDEYSIATTLNSIGIIHFRLKNYDEAIKHYNHAIAIMTKLEEEIDIADGLHNLGNVYATMGQYEKAITHYTRALAIDEKLGNQWGIAYQKENLGLVYSDMGNLRQALNYQKEALEIRKALGQKKEIAMSNNKVGFVLSEMNQNQQAVGHFLEGARIAKEIGSNPDLKDSYEFLSRAYAKLGNYKKAYENHKQYSHVQDSIFNQTSAQQINELKARYEAEKKEQEIQLLTSEKKIQGVEIAQQKAIKNGFIMGSILLLILIVVLYVAYKNRIQAIRLINKQKQEINSQKIKELENNQKLFALDAMISGQEAERKRIASDLHDGLGVLLSTAQMHFNSVDNKIDHPNGVAMYGKANALLDEACIEVRKIAHNMMPGSLLKLGLVPALNDLCEKLKKKDELEISLEAFEMDHRFKETAEITIYRLIQEMLNNVIKHAKASEVIVQLMNNNENFNITVEDNGIGFNVYEALNSGGMGLKSIESRVKYLNGNLNIVSEQGKGTSVTVDIDRKVLFKE